MGYITLPLSVIFGIWIAWSLWRGEVNVHFWRHVAHYEGGHFARRHDPLRFWLAISILGVFSIFCMVVTIMAYRMDVAW